MNITQKDIITLKLDMLIERLDYSIRSQLDARDYLVKFKTYLEKETVPQADEESEELDEANEVRPSR